MSEISAGVCQLTKKRITNGTKSIALGDIHSERDQLNRLLNTVAPTNKDRFVFLGDDIDRGNICKGVVYRLISCRDKFPDSVFIRGNLDLMFLDAHIEDSSITCPPIVQSVECLSGQCVGIEHRDL